ILSLFSKSPIQLKEAIQKYGIQHYPNQPFATFYNSYDDALKDSTSEDKLKVLLENDYSGNSVNKDTNGALFNFKTYFDELNTILFGQQVFFTRLMSSTQLVSMKYFTNTMQGLAVVADQQNKAVGRGNNKWESPLGCLIYSFKCKQTDGNKLPFLQYVCGVALVEAVLSFPEAKDLNIRLKWPNDVYGNGLKIGGILCQSNYSDNEFDVVIGIGINVTNSNNPTITINQMIHLKEEQKKQKGHVSNPDSITPVYITREALLAKFFNIFEKIYIEFTKEGFAPLKQRYIDLWMHSNQIVHLKEQNKTVKIVGLEDNGFLKAVELDEKGNQVSNQYHELHPDGTSFDIDNLILKKKE
ncbi:hypothetical protein DICPUDRAFT_18614, partial [Dictyostelium purpureum]